MDDTKLRFGVGVLVLSAVGVGIILTFLFGAFPAVLASNYNLIVDMDSAAGVSQNTPVLRDGVRIGRVTEIELKPEGGVRLMLSIDSARQLNRSYVPRTVTGSLITGDAKLEFQKDRSAALDNLDGQAPVGESPIAKNNKWDPPEETLASTYYSDGDYILSNRSSSDDPMAVIANLQNDVRNTLESMRQAGAAIESAGSSVDKLADSVRGVVSENETSIRDITVKATQSLDEFHLAMIDIRTIVNDPQLRASLKNTLDALPGVLDEAEDALFATKTTMRQFEKVGVAAEQAVGSAGETFQSLDRTIVNIEKFTEPLGERGDELIQQVLVSFANLDSALIQISSFGEMVNNSDGTLRKLIEDDEIYYQVKRTIGNVENASVRIRPILDDVRVFTDKLARDPRELGVKGALSSRPSGMGLK
jgi:phospholipid/cholesterol/gamma-HCH transport system substrate-binding protein